MLHYTPEFIAAEQAYRRERLMHGQPTVAPPRPRRQHGSLVEAVLGRYGRRLTSRPAVGH